MLGSIVDDGINFDAKSLIDSKYVLSSVGAVILCLLPFVRALILALPADINAGLVDRLRPTNTSAVTKHAHNMNRNMHMPNRDSTTIERFGCFASCNGCGCLLFRLSDCVESCIVARRRTKFVVDVDDTIWVLLAAFGYCCDGSAIGYYFLFWCLFVLVGIYLSIYTIHGNLC